MNDMMNVIAKYTNKPLEEKARWYSPAAQAYDKARPHYPDKLISWVARMGQLGPHSRILEAGCGPGTATIAFAEFGCSIVCVEPNLDFCKLARKNCRQFSKVMIKQTSFEEWPMDVSAFDLVISASAFHWIQPEVGYPKVASALHDDGYFILLWNLEPQPATEVWQSFDEIYKQHELPWLSRYKTEAEQHHTLKALALPAINSGIFKEVAFKQVKTELSYTTENYLLLLSSFSPYLSLEESIRNSLFSSLRKKINDDMTGFIDLSYISAANILQKITN